ncbi:MAG: polyprenyl synthetase family protein, partial [Selenomonadaceae bacterium]|nr:polyprenyl synthetase family protein [Selenomonadaceae bacterium]
AILAQASEKNLDDLTRYAENFGLAFQITDDILDVTGDEKILGKPIGSDAKNLKSTYVSLTSLEEAKNFAQAAVDEALKSLEDFGSEADFLRELVRYLIARKK